MLTCGNSSPTGTVVLFGLGLSSWRTNNGATKALRFSSSTTTVGQPYLGLVACWLDRRCRRTYRHRAAVQTHYVPVALAQRLSENILIDREALPALAASVVTLRRKAAIVLITRPTRGTAVPHR